MALSPQVQAVVRRCGAQLRELGFDVRGRYAVREHPVGLVMYLENWEYASPDAPQIDWRASIGGGRRMTKRFERQRNFFNQVEQRPDSEPWYGTYYPVGSEQVLAEFEADFARYTVPIIGRCTSVEQIVQDVLSDAYTPWGGRDLFAKARTISFVAEVLQLEDRYSPMVRQLLGQYATWTGAPGATVARTHSMARACGLRAECPDPMTCESRVRAGS